MTAAPSDLAERVALLEAELARIKTPSPARRPRRRAAWRLGLVGVVVALIIPTIALAGAEFSDVPTNHKFHDDIQAIANAGITSGCPQGTNRYCPDGLVTRGQMAAFLNRLGALSPGKPPKVNADRVDGYHANALSRVAGMSTANTTPIPANGTFVQYGPDIVITAPAPGYVTVNFGFTAQSGDCTTSCQAYGYAMHEETSTSRGPGETWVNSSTILAAASVHAVFQVGAGTNTFSLRLQRANGGNGTINGWFGTGDAIYTPFGASGVNPGVASLGTDGSDGSVAGTPPK